AGSRARPDATVRWRKRTQIAGAWFPAEPCEEELEAGRAIRAEPEPGYVFVFGQPVTVVRPGPVGAGRVGPRGPGSGAMPGRRLLEADRPERVGRRCAVAILVEFDLPRDALVIVSGVRERGAKRGGVGVRAGCHERAHADPDRVVRRQPERIDGGLGSTGDLLQQRVVTVLGALRERDQRAREAAGLLGERDGL